MDSERDIAERVKRRAYELWEAAGRPEGRGEEFWHQASAEITPSGAKEDVPVRKGRAKPTV